MDLRLAWDADSDRLDLAVQDDGRGFTPAAIEDLAGQGHFGLAGIRERVALIGGQWRLESAPGQGTSRARDLARGRRRPVPLIPSHGHTWYCSTGFLRSKTVLYPHVNSAPFCYILADITVLSRGTPMTRVLIVDDQSAFRLQLRRLLERAGMDVVAEAGDIPEAEAQARTLHPDLAVVDVILPGISGLEGVPQLKATASGLRVIVVSAHQDQAHILRDAAAASGRRVLRPEGRLWIWRLSIPGT